jgi:anaerobic magnesium-protoporphyrin IX monomethyl ester cyclase
MKVLLINPSRINGMKFFNYQSDYDFEIEGDDYGQFPPLGLLYIGSALKKARPQDEVKLIDAIAEKMSGAELEQRIRDFDPDFVGLSTFTMVMYDCCLIARLVKKINPNAHICFGGPHISDFPVETANLPDVDSIVLGEGENTIVDLMDHLEQNQSIENIPGVFTQENASEVTHKKSQRPMVDNLDDLPFPDRSLLKQELYYNAIGFEKNIASIITSRGCPKQCTFCGTMRSNYRMRSVPNILEEIKLILDDGIKEIFFQDDTFNLLGERAKIFCREVIASNLKFTWSFKARVDQIDDELMDLAYQAGCRQLHIGVETGNQEGLDFLKKGVTIGQLTRAFNLAHKYNIRTIADWMIGMPFEKNMDDIDKNFQFLLDLNPFYAQINVLQPFPYTELFSQAEKAGLDNLARWQKWCANPQPEFEKSVWTESFTASELNSKAEQLYRKFYFRLEYLGKSITHLMSFRDFARKVQGAKRLFFNSTKKLRNQQRKTFGVDMIPEFESLRVKSSNMPLVTTPKKYLPAGGIKGQ